MATDFMEAQETSALEIPACQVLLKNMSYEIVHSPAKGVYNVLSLTCNVISACS